MLVTCVLIYKNLLVDFSYTSFMITHTIHVRNFLLSIYLSKWSSSFIFEIHKVHVLGPDRLIFYPVHLLDTDYMFEAISNIKRPLSSPLSTAMINHSQSVSKFAPVLTELFPFTDNPATAFTSPEYRCCRTQSEHLQKLYWGGNWILLH